jgi:heme/copper-type cytochrome/quinol oxidase subunit 2
MIERDSTATAGNNTPIIIAVIVIAVVVIGLFVWQPWNQRSTTGATGAQTTTNGQTTTNTTTTGSGTSGGGTAPTKP